MPSPRPRAKSRVRERLPWARPIASTSAIRRSRTSCGSFRKRLMALPKPARSLRFRSPAATSSFYNETLGEGIYPTPVLGVVGILDDVSKAAKMHFATAGRTIVLLRTGEAADITDVESEFGSSEYAKEILGALWGYPPELDLEREAGLQKAVVELIQQGLGGVRARLRGRRIGCSACGKRISQGRGGAGESCVEWASGRVFVVWGRCEPHRVCHATRGNVTRIQEIANEYGAVADVLGETISERLEISLDGQMVVSAAVSDLDHAYESALESTLRTDPELVAED